MAHLEIPFDESAVVVAPRLLGAHLTHRTDTGFVTVRITEVEAYEADGDPASHAFRGESPRTASMFGPPGRLYAYFTYGMHVCCNIVCSPPGDASAVLVRAGEVVAGHELARERRGLGISDRDVARGPARLTVALGIRLSDDGADLEQSPFSLEPPSAVAPFARGPRTGIRVAADVPWRFWIPNDPFVSPYRRHPHARVAHAPL